MSSTGQTQQNNSPTTSSGTPNPSMQQGGFGLFSGMAGQNNAGGWGFAGPQTQSPQEQAYPMPYASSYSGGLFGNVMPDPVLARNDVPDVPSWDQYASNAQPVQQETAVMYQPMQRQMPAFDRSQYGPDFGVVKPYAPPPPPPSNDANLPPWQRGFGFNQNTQQGFMSGIYPGAGESSS